MTALTKKAKLLIIALLFLLAGAIYGYMNWAQHSQGFTSSMFMDKDLHISKNISSISSVSLLSIDPAEVEMPATSSKVFTAYQVVGTGTVPVVSNWSIAQNGQRLDKENNPYRILLRGCQNSPTCTLHSSAIAVDDLLLTATSAVGSKTATVTVLEDLPPAPFNDELPEWARATISELYDRGVIAGYADGNFGPTDPVTRAQATLLLYRLIGLYEVDTAALLSANGTDCAATTFADVPADHYAYDAICFARAFGWFNDITFLNNSLLPNEPASRSYIAIVVANMAANGELNEIFLEEEVEGQENPYQDVNGATPGRAQIQRLYDLGIMTGSETDLGRNFRPNDQINRAEMATVLGNLLQNMAPLFETP